MFYLINNETAAANSLMKKMAEQAKPGALIPCTREEIDCFNNGDFVPVAMTQTESKLIEIDRSRTYVIFVDENMNIDDAVKLQNEGVDINIIEVNR
jgi:hypothetical protein